MEPDWECCGSKLDNSLYAVRFVSILQKEKEGVKRVRGGAQKVLWIFFLLSLFLTLCFSPPPNQAYAEESSHESKWISRYSSQIDWGNGTFTSTSFIGPQTFWNGSGWQELNFEDHYESDGYFLIENAHVSAWIYDWYSVFYDPDNSHVCVDDERWIVEVWSGKKWREVDLYSPRLSYSNNETHLAVTRSFDCPEGLFNVSYIVWRGSFLKHDVVFESRMEGSNQFRVIMKLTGIYHDKVKHSEGTETITSEKHIVSPYFFVGENNSNLVLSEYLWTLGEVNETSGEWQSKVLKDVVFNVHSKGCKADVLIGNYTLSWSECLEIDPATSTCQVSGSNNDCCKDYINNVWEFTTTSPCQKVGCRWASGPVISYKMGGGIRFIDVGIPHNLSIESAYLRVTGISSRSITTVNSNITGEDTDNATAFSSLSDYDNRTRTTAVVNWDNISAWTKDTTYRSPNITSIIAEITNRSGWSSGSAIVIFWDDHDDRSSYINGAMREGYSYDGSASNCVKLEVTWTSTAPATMTLQATSSDGTNLPRQVTFNGTMENGTAFDEDSSQAGHASIDVHCGAHVVNTWWGDHLVDSRTVTISKNESRNIDTKIQRLSSGSYYILFSLNNTDLPTVDYISNTKLKFPAVSGVGTVEFKMDNTNWMQHDEPKSITVGAYTYVSTSPGWSYSNHIFTFPIQFSTRDITISWETPSEPSGPIYIPGEPSEIPEVEPEPEIPAVPGIPPTGFYFKPSADLSTLGVVIIAGVIALGFVSHYLETHNIADLWRKKTKRKRVEWKGERKRAEWKSKKRKKTKWKEKK